MKLRGKAKEEFLKRMARGRKKAAAKNPRKRSQRAKNSAARSRSSLRAKAKNPTRGKKRRNPDSEQAAIEKFTEFHGRGPSKIIEYEEAIRYHGNLAEMGKLKQLEFDLDQYNRNFPLGDFKGAQAVCTPDGRNIYFVGGNQTIDFDALNIASDKDMAELGPCTKIVYDTQKGFHDFEQINYWHKFGEESGILPVLCYDRLNRSLFLVGGDYQVRPEGIVN